MACTASISILLVPFSAAYSLHPSSPASAFIKSAPIVQRVNPKNCVSPQRILQTAQKTFVCRKTSRNTVFSMKTASVRTYFPAAERIIAIGDVHGDAKALRSCLNMAGVMDSKGSWIGGRTHLVQV
jgi:hypothetical protein